MILFALLQRLFGLLSFGLLGLSLWLLWSWRALDREAELFRLDEPTHARLYWGLGLLLVCVMGRPLILLLTGRGGGMAPSARREGVAEAGADGARLRMEVEGCSEGPILLLTHGWGLSSRIWADSRQALAERFGVVTWDLPGTGGSTRPTQGWSIDGFADDLSALIDRLPADRAIILIGHSIGGMTVQTFCLRHASKLGGRVSGIVLENTTHQNPLRTMVGSDVLTRLQPLIVLMLQLDILLSPVIWLMNWQSYFSGSTHLAMRLAGFGARPTRAQINLSALLPTRTSPAVQAHGNLAMIRWSVTARLSEIDVPALVIVGGRDLVTKAEAGEHIAGALPRSTLKRVADAGHMGPVEKHQTYVAAVTDFVERITALRPMEPPA